MRPTLYLTALALCASCRKPAAPIAPAPSAPACDEDLSGLWLNASDTHFAYRLRDHGSAVRGEFMHREEDGGLTPPDDPVLFDLQRTDAGVSGFMTMTGPSPNGRPCRVRYGIQLTTCHPASFQAQVETSVPITDACERYRFPDGGLPPFEFREFLFQRAPAQQTGTEPPSTDGDRRVSH